MENDDTEKGLYSRVKSWAAHPFTAQMDLVHWFLFAGLLLVIVILWLQILNAITYAAKEAVSA